MTGIPLLRKNRLTKTIKTMKKLLLLLFAAALSLSASEPARAWGREGHETIAKIAERNLTKRAKKRIEKYLGGHSVVYYAKWMDEYRPDPEGLARGRCRFLHEQTGAPQRGIWDWGYLQTVSTGLVLMQIGQRGYGKAMLDLAGQWERVRVG